MDHIQKRADDKAWDQKQGRWISDANRSVEDGLSGDALAASHGLHVPAANALSYDVDQTSEMDPEGTLRDKIIRRLVQIGDAISENDHLPDDVKQRWTGALQQCYASDAKSMTLLRDLRGDLDRWEQVDPQSELSLVYGAIGALAVMIEVYQRRFKTR